MRLMRFMDDHGAEAARHNAAGQAFAEVVRLFLVVGFLAHALCPLRQTGKKRRLIPQVACDNCRARTPARPSNGGAAAADGEERVPVEDMKAGVVEHDPVGFAPARELAVDGLAGGADQMRQV